ncbi:MAG TPA: hypothetical protein VNS63_15740 [Blastocatellia bacterium]|nr:hypothetical protein [Blastocatellia bacterium]
MVLPHGFASTLITTETQDVDEGYSFENDFQGWTVHATQVNPDLPPPITLSQERAKDGATSLRFLVNRDDSFQFIWIERVLDVEPNQVYDVNIDYALGTADCCSNPFFNLAGVLKKTPVTLNDFFPVLQDVVDTKENTTVGYKWVDKQYAFTTRSDDQGKFHIIIGFYGADPVRRIEFIDDVHLKVTKRTEPCEFFSFEQDLEGWTPEAIDMSVSDGGFKAWSIAPSPLVAQDGYYSLKFFTTNSNKEAKVFIVRPFNVERKKTYRVTVEYGFDNGSVTSGARLITGVLKDKPETAEDLVASYQDKAKKSPEVQGWQRKRYEFTLQSKKSDVLYVIIGIAAKKSGHHLYCFDSACITITAK